jgi:peptidoglycan/xylan/chitin deacetylase (PgdA/CDA1 family)
MYHGVSKNKYLKSPKHLSYDLFRAQLIKLKQHYEFTSIDNLTGLLSNKAIKNPLLAITFDDGYKNNYSAAAEILDDLGLPATFFISTGYIGTNKWMWTDLVEYSIMSSKQDSVKISDLGIELPLSAPGNKALAISSIKSLLKSKDFYQTQSLVEGFSKSLLGSDYVDPFDDYQFMSWDDIKELSRAPFAIGAHTVNHPILTNVSQSIAEQEILNSRDDIINHIGTCSKTFCYPNGKITDYNQAIMNFTSLHFDSAISTVYGYARADEMYQLRRVGVSNSLGCNKLFRRVANLTYGT